MPCDRPHWITGLGVDSSKPLGSIVACLALFVSLLSGSPALAAAGDPAPPNPENADPTTTDAFTTGTPIALSQAIALGLRNNLEVEVNRYEPYIAALDAEAAWGAFDPTFSGTIAVNDIDIPTNSAFAPEFESRDFGGDMGFEALVPYLGASASLTYESNKQTTNNTTASFSPALASRLILGGEVPLMRGLIWNEPWTQVRTSKLSAQAADSDFETSVMNTVQAIINSYWKLVATKEQLRVAETALETAEALLDQTQTQYEVGVVSKVDVVEAEAGVANRQFEKIVARNDYQNANDELIATLLGRRLRAGTNIVFAPTDNPSFEAANYVDVENMVAEAFEKRPELKAFEDRIEQAKIQEKFARNQRLPEVNFTGSYSTEGLSGDALPPIIGFPPPTNPPVTGDYGDTFNSWFDSRVWTAGARVSIPIPNTAARKNFNKAEFELRRAESRRTQFKQNIIVDIRAAARGLIASAEGVEAAERGRVAAAEQLRAERIRLEHGESTPFDVLQRQNDLVSAESRKVAALQTYRDSQAALDRARGSILEVYNVQITKVRQLD